MKTYKEQLLVELKRLRIPNWSFSIIAKGLAIRLPEDEQVEEILKSFPSILIKALHVVGKPEKPVEIRLFNNKGVSRYNLNPHSIPDTIEHLI